MSLRTYLEAAFKDGKAPIDPSTLVIQVHFSYRGLYTFVVNFCIREIRTKGFTSAFGLNTQMFKVCCTILI